LWKANIEKAGKYDVYIEYSVSDKEAGKTRIKKQAKLLRCNMAIKN